MYRILILAVAVFAGCCWIVEATAESKEQKIPNNFYCVDNHGDVSLCPNNQRPELFATNLMAYSRFANRLNATGWMEFELVTNPDIDDDTQAYFAGYLEGYLTPRYIDSFRINQLREKNSPKCEKFRNFIERNLNATLEKIHFGSGDPYWLNVRYTLHQVAGMDDGYHGKKNVSKHLNIDPCGTIMINLYDELDDFEKMMPESKPDKCSAIIKIVEDKKKNTTDVLVSHITWSHYFTMIRMMKLYTFNFQQAAAKSVSFPSYPGNIYSTDDYYITSKHLVIQETTLENHNRSSFKHNGPETFVFEFIRTVVANRLAETSRSWADIFHVQNSGSYSNQFMIVDYKQKSGNVLEKGFLTVLEQMPHYMHIDDQTEHLKKTGYWASYNIPFYKDIYALANYAEPLIKYGDLYSFERSPRGRIFARDQHKVTNITTCYKLMRYNDFKNDHFSQCEDCNPHPNGLMTIAARADLTDPKVQYKNPGLRFRIYGAIDVKITNEKLSKNLEMIAENGPTHEGHAPFSWATAAGPDESEHRDVPDVMNFNPVITRWSADEFPEYKFDF